VRRRHRRATGSGITSIGRVTSRAGACAGSGDIWLDTIAAIDSDGAAIAKAGDGICPSVQSSCSVRSRIPRRRPGLGTRSDGVDTAASGTVVTRCDHHLNTSSSLRFNCGLQFVACGAAFRRRAAPGVNCDVGCLRWIALIRRAVKRVRRQEPFHTFDVSGWCAVALIHVTATNPFCTGRHPDLVTIAVVTNGCAGGVRAVEEIIARLLRIIPAGISRAVVYRIVPVIIVIRVLTVPAAVVRLQCVMRPSNTSIGTGYNNVLPGETERPDLRGMRILDTRFDGSRYRRRFLGSARLREVVVDHRIALYMYHVWASCECVRKLATTLHENCIHNVERLIFDAAVAQQLENWFLRTLGLS